MNWISKKFINRNYAFANQWTPKTKLKQNYFFVFFSRKINISHLNAYEWLAGFMFIYFEILFQVFVINDHVEKLL